MARPAQPEHTCSTACSSASWLVVNMSVPVKLYSEQIEANEKKRHYNKCTRGKNAPRENERGKERGANTRIRGTAAGTELQAPAPASPEDFSSLRLLLTPA